MFGGGGDPGPTYLLEIVEKGDVVDDGCLGEEYCLLFLDGGGKTCRGGSKVKIVE